MSYDLLDKLITDEYLAVKIPVERIEWLSSVALPDFSYIERLMKPLAAYSLPIYDFRLNAILQLDTVSLQALSRAYDSLLPTLWHTYSNITSTFVSKSVPIPVIEEKYDVSIPENATKQKSSVLEDGFDIHEYEKIISLLDGSVCEDGYINQLEQFVIDLFDKVPMRTCTYLSKLQQDYLNDLDVQETILHILSHIDYERVYPLGQSIVTSIQGTHSQNVIIQDRVIRCFEHWANSEGIQCLSKIVCSTKWLEEYRLQTIEFLGETL